MIGVNFGTLCHIFAMSRSPYRESLLREEFKKHVKPFVSDISKYGRLSMKSGAASNPAS